MIKFRLVVLLFACLSLSGCATLQLMSWGASGISYVATGKSISDHAISTVMKKDCALHRGVFGEQTCVDYDGDGVIRGIKPGEHSTIINEGNWQNVARNQNSVNMPDRAENRQLPPIHHPQVKSQSNRQSHVKSQVKSQAPNLRNNTATAKFTRTSVSPDTTVRKLMAKQEAQPSSPYVDKPALFAVVGSYNNRHFAQNNIAKQAMRSKLKAKLMVNSADVIAQGAPKYRVVIGPLTANQFSTSLGDVGENANHEAWRMTLCQQTLLPPPCDSNMFAANRQ